MPRTRIIPVLLLHNGGLYKTVKFKHPVYVGDPINTVRLFNEKEADELMLLDYRASKEKGKIDFGLISAVAGEAFMPMSYGGGIRSFEDAVKIFHAGFEKVVLNTVLFENPGIVKQIADVYGSQAVTAAMDVGRDLFGRMRVYAESGTVKKKVSPEEWIVKLEKMGAGEVLVNNIDRDGTWDGYDLDLIHSLAEKVSIPLVACGGAGGVDDLRRAVDAGASAVAAGSMFVFQKKGMGVLVSFPGEVI
ncbi:MAG: imidazole glycerol phosphate synthase subunit HisF [Chitinophagaceae bacterium]|nr:imidazole glycerol phosphate synthase subunit HisF [Chitinophagaceae bacterium]